MSTVPTIEILCYQPVNNDLAKFIKFCIEGKRKASGEFEVDSQGRKITGVLDWLHSRKVPEAHFFDSGKNERIHFFMATVHRLEDFDVPWIRRIPGFDETVNTEGLIGTTDKFAPPTELIAALQSNGTLDKKFADTKIKLDEIFAQMGKEKVFSFDERKLVAALRGDKDVDVEGVFAEVNDKFGLSL
jgi:hypothetical protein